jgi:hypothetical protein
MPADKRLNEVIRVQKRPNNFVMLDKGFLENENLSWKAKGILAYLLSKPDNWKAIVGDIVKHSKDGKTAVYAGLVELSAYGYYEKIPVRSTDGRRIDHWESTVYELPQATNPENAENTPSSLLTDFQEIDNQEIGNLFIENRERNNNDFSNNYFNKNHVSQVMSATPDRRDKDRTDAPKQTPEQLARYIEDYTRWIYKNVCYTELAVARPYDMNLIDEFIAVIVDTHITEGFTVRIDGENKPRALVMSYLHKLTYDDMEHAVDQFKSVSEPIRKKKQYILTLLYNCKMERDAHYTNQYQSEAWQ